MLGRADFFFSVLDCAEENSVAIRLRTHTKLRIRKLIRPIIELTNDKLGNPLFFRFVILVEEGGLGKVTWVPKISFSVLWAPLKIPIFQL